MADERPGPRFRAADRGRPDDRGHGPPPGSRPPFRPGPRADFAQPLAHTIRLRDGEREIEVSGSAGFIRQILDDLPTLWSRLQGHEGGQPAAIRMPLPPRDAAAE